MQSDIEGRSNLKHSGLSSAASTRWDFGPQGQEENNFGLLVPVLLRYYGIVIKIMPSKMEAAGTKF